MLCWQASRNAGLALRAEAPATKPRSIGSLHHPGKAGPQQKNHPGPGPGVAHVATGRARGIEPPNGGATSRCLNRLATPAACSNHITAGSPGSSWAGRRHGSLQRRGLPRVADLPWIAPSCGVAASVRWVCPGDSRSLPSWSENAGLRRVRPRQVVDPKVQPGRNNPRRGFTRQAVLDNFRRRPVVPAATRFSW